MSPFEPHEAAAPSHAVCTSPRLVSSFQCRRTQTPLPLFLAWCGDDSTMRMHSRGNSGQHPPPPKCDWHQGANSYCARALRSLALATDIGTKEKWSQCCHQATLGYKLPERRCCRPVRRVSRRSLSLSLSLLTSVPHFGVAYSCVCSLRAYSFVFLYRKNPNFLSPLLSFTAGPHALIIIDPVPTCIIHCNKVGPQYHRSGVIRTYFPYQLFPLLALSQCGSNFCFVVGLWDLPLYKSLINLKLSLATTVIQCEQNYWFKKATPTTTLMQYLYTLFYTFGN